MKTNFWKRAAALLLALVLCFACLGTASAAEDVSGKVYLISYPRDGDENYHRLHRWTRIILDNGLRRMTLIRPQIALMDTDCFEQRIKTDDTDCTDN